MNLATNLNGFKFIFHREIHRRNQAQACGTRLAAKLCEFAKPLETSQLGLQTSGFRRTCPAFLVFVLRPARHCKNQANVLLFLLRALKATEPRIKLR
jgi:hypothetical protein